MNKDSYRYTLDHATIGTMVVVDPIGWDTNPIKLQRDTEYCGVLETFESTLTFVTEAAQYLDSVRALGVDSEVSLLVEISSDFGSSYETFFHGLIDVQSLVVLASPTDYKVQGAVKKDDVWSLFMSRKSTPVDVLSVTDLDENAVAPATIEDINLPCQTIRRHCRTEMWLTTDPDFVDQFFEFFIVASFVPAIDLPKSIFDELQTKYHYAPSYVLNTTDRFLFPIIEALETATQWDIDVSIVLSKDAAYQYQMAHSGTPGDEVKLFLERADGENAPVLIPLVITQVGVDGVSGRTEYTYTGTEYNILKGTKLLLRAGNAITDKVGYVVPNDIYTALSPTGPSESHFDIIAHTTAPASTTKAIRTVETLDAIIKRITGGDNFHSDFFNDCGFDYVHMLGKHLRGDDFTIKPFAPNFADFFKNAQALHNLGLGYEDVSGTLKIRAEEKAFFFDGSAVSINLSYVNNISRTFKKGGIYNGVGIGYSKSQLSGGGSLIDDPQTIHKYAGPSRFTGEQIDIDCGWIAASLLFELTRRAVTKPGETFDTDEDTFVLKISGSDPDLAMTGSSDLLDAAGRYNKTLTPARNFRRWINVLSVGLGQYQLLGRAFKFISGVGNFLASVTIATDSCAGTDVDTVTENENIDISANVLFGIDVVTFTHPLTWEEYKTIRDNKTKAIGVSETSEDHVPYFIDTIEFTQQKREAKFTLFSKT